MLKLFSLLLFISSYFLSACSDEKTHPLDTKDSNTTKSVLNQVQLLWNFLNADALEILPQVRVSYAKLFDGTVDLITRDAQRTLSDKEDVLDYFNKLAHPNGVCMRGTWEIDTPNIYGGYFKNGSKSLLIGRASSALSNTKKGETRAFGLALKLFGTMDETEILTTPSANIFVIDNLGGTDAEYFTDVALTNEPNVSFTRSVFASFAYALKVANTFSKADKNFGIRQLYEVSYLHENKSSNVITPKWIKIDAQKGQTKFDAEDFRDEFKLEKDERLIFNIWVASREDNSGKIWKKIGQIIFDAFVVSTSCDHRLHFHHPRWRDDLSYN